jgi:chromosome partitioning protein
MRIALLSQKGGSGKSSLSTFIACELQQAHNARVLLVDADPQRSVVTWAEVASEQGYATPVVVGMGSDLHRQIPGMEESFDHIIIDTPGRSGTIMRAALMAADLALVPCSPSPVEPWALADTLEVIREGQTLRPELAVALLINRRQSRTGLATTVREALEQTGFPVLETEIGFRVAYQEAMGAGQGVTQYAPRDAAAREIRDLVCEILSLEEGGAHASETPAAASR